MTHVAFSNSESPASHLAQPQPRVLISQSLKKGGRVGAVKQGGGGGRDDQRGLPLGKRIASPQFLSSWTCSFLGRQL